MQFVLRDLITRRASSMSFRGYRFSIIVKFQFFRYEFSETFKMSGSTFNLLNPHDATDSECFRNNMSDYLLIPNAIAINSYGESIAANYFCGTSLAKATVTCMFRW